MAAAPFKVKATFDYTSGHEDDLSFSNGQIITVTDVEDDDWYFGEYSDAQGASKKGLFPKNFVERYEPVTPPRPSRAAKREPEPELPSQPQAQPKPATAPQATTIPHPEDQEEVEEEVRDEIPEKSVSNETVPAAPSGGDGRIAALPNSGVHNVRDLPIRSSRDPPTASSQSLEQATKDAPPPSAGTRSPPPAIAEKPTSSSFRDRIAAFNKPAAAPPTPIKPGQAQGSSFIKKPFVPPPPSRNAYVPIPKDPPPQKIYRREEDSDLQDPINEASAPNIVTATSGDGDGDDQPKPTSLKERIALLQKQQLEQVARQAEGAAAKKEKPRKPPPRKQSEIAAEDEHELGVATDEPVAEAAGTERTSLDAPRPPQMPQTIDRTPVLGTTVFQGDSMSDSNDADQSAGGDTEDGEPNITRRLPRAPAPRSVPSTRPSGHEEDVHPAEQVLSSDGDQDQPTKDEAEEEEEEDLDPEIRRRMEIRERMAKMSGGMGMAGMFGPAGGLPPLSGKKIQPASVSSRAREDDQTPAQPTHPVPIMALPGMAMPGLGKVKSPEQEDANVNEMEQTTERFTHDAASESEADTSEEEGEENSSRPLPPLPTERSAPAPPVSRAVPPVPVASARAPPPPPPSDSRPPPPLPPNSQFLSAGEDSDDELSTAQEGDNKSVNTAASPPRGAPPPPIPRTASGGLETAPISPTSAVGSPKFTKSSTFPQSSPASSEKRISRPPPPVPGNAPSAPVARAPPPPPPQTTSGTTQTANSTSAFNPDPEESEEVTEYEGDYDTDIAAGESHKDALTAEQGSSADETLTGDEAAYHHSGLPSIGFGSGASAPPIPGASAPRGAPPPPPPREAPRIGRQSSDLPRPPPLPPAAAPGKPRQSNDLPRGAPPPVPQNVIKNDGEYDPFNYGARPPIPTRASQRSVETPKAEQEDDDLYSSSPPRTARAPPPEPPSVATPSLLTPQVSSTTTRQSLDAPRAGPARTSMDNRPSMDNSGGFMAHEVDVARPSHWWTQRKMPPPSIQGRPDIAYEVEESTAIQQNGGELILKHVYILFADYSQTVLTVRFAQADPSNAEFSQRHEAPPAQLRQDQLEAAHEVFGARIAEKANQHVNHVVGNGTPMAFITELLHNFTDAVPNVGARAFGAVVYANLANATVQQLDEIRTGDIITFRNTKMQGHKGPMKQKYNIDVGKPDHVAVVVDWDGTKKKVRAWEQGRESKKVKIESFKLGDIKSGEVKIWRVVGREWIGWGSKS